jgi:signal transduction histidine kinase
MSFNGSAMPLLPDRVGGSDGSPGREGTVARTHLVAAIEAERARIARDLHDVVGQALTTVRLSVLSLDRIDGMTGASGANISRSLAVIDDALRQVRTAAFDLRPAVLDDLGLAAALRALGRQVQRQTRTVVSCRVEVGESRLAPEIETTCFRVAQEAITNAVRHAGARHLQVRLQLRLRAHLLVLEVRDDGVGFDPAQCSGATCLGIAGMAERASLVGGSVAIRSEPGAGTRVTARFALDHLPGATR